jgi:uncharacterized repeat protein (TIGR03803 family)
MKTFAFRHTLGLGIAAALLGGCGAAANGTQPPIAAGDVAQQSRIASTTFKSLYSFKAAPDGANPASPLLNFHGTLYGTTVNGGSGGGTVFKMSASGRGRG